MDMKASQIFNTMAMSAEELSEKQLRRSAPSSQSGNADAQQGETQTQGAQYHSELAMQAARKMRRTRQKQKTGQIVCHHLKMMLASDDNAIHRPVPSVDQSDQQQYRLGF